MIHFEVIMYVKRYSAFASSGESSAFRRLKSTQERNWRWWPSTYHTHALCLRSGAGYVWQLSQWLIIEHELDLLLSCIIIYSILNLNLMLLCFQSQFFIFCIYSGCDEWRLYEYITRHFIASVSQDCKYLQTTIDFNIGTEVFSCSGKTLIAAGTSSTDLWSSQNVYLIKSNCMIVRQNYQCVLPLKKGDIIILYCRILYYIIIWYETSF